MGKSWMDSFSLSSSYTNDPFPKKLKQAFTGVVAGGSMFCATATFSQAMQTLIGINTAKPSLGYISSFVTLVGGLLLSWECAESVSKTKTRYEATVGKKIKDMKLARSYQNQSSLSNVVLGDVSMQDSHFLNALREGVRETEYRLERHGTSIVISLLGMIIFHGLGGRGLSFVPSNVRNLGAFARTRAASLPAGLSYATDKERGALINFGNRYGCHTCGLRKPSKKSGVTWIADHQPPLKYAKEQNSKLWRRVTGRQVTQRFYPQCSLCSAVQSSAVRTPSAEAVVTHHMLGHKNHNLFGAFRLYHLTGALLIAGAEVAIEVTDKKK